MADEPTKTEGNQDANTQQTQPPAPAATPPAPPLNPPAVATESPRTAEQFEKLLQSNQELKTQAGEMMKLLQAQQQLNTEAAQKAQTPAPGQTQQTPTPTPPAQPQLNVKDFVETDEYGGQVVNLEKLQNTLSQSDQKVTAIEKQFQDTAEQQRRQDEIRQTQEAYAEYPELNKEADGHNADFARLTRQILVDSYAYQDDYGGIPLTFKQAADRAKVYMDAVQKGATPQEAQAEADKEGEKQTAENQQKVEEQKQQAEQQKQEASLEATGSSQAGQEEITDAQKAELVRRTRQGDNWALAERLQSVEHTGTPTSSQ